MKDCHGCGGKGWVELSHGQAVKCPVCGGAGKLKLRLHDVEGLG